MDREQKGLGPLPDQLDELEQSSEPPSRQMMVSVMVGMLGMSVEAANTEYDRQLAENTPKGT